jgi:hypothetical protein
VLDSVITPGFTSGVWYGWVFLLSPLNGIVLGPLDGFITTLISVLVGHTIVFRESVYEYIFTLGAPIASLTSGLIYRKNTRYVIFYFLLLIGAYFLTPITQNLPLWGMWDVFLAFLVLLSWSLSENYVKIRFFNRHRVQLAFAALIGLEADILFRIFILVPCRGYSIFYGLSPQVLAAIWAVPAPIITPIKVIIAIFLTVFLVPRVITILKKFNIIILK